MTPPKPIGRPPDLSIEIAPAEGGTYRWDAEAPNPEDRPGTRTFGTKLMEGFGPATVTLPRSPRLPSPDLGLYDTLRMIAPDGRIAYEGRGDRFTGSTRDGGTKTIDAVGWMNHARDRPITAVYVDHDLGAWGPPSAAREWVIAVNDEGILHSGEILPDRSGDTAVVLVCPALYENRAELWYAAPPGAFLGKIYFSLDGSGRDADRWDSVIGLYHNDDSAISADEDELAAGSVEGYLTALGVEQAYRFAAVRLAYDFAAEGTDEQRDRWTQLTVYGDHNFTLVGTNPRGVLASDVVKHSAALGAPLLDTSEVQGSSAVIDQLVFGDPTDPYDIWLTANVQERWGLHVWEERKLHYAALDETPVWVIRTDDPDVDAEIPEAATNTTANGIIVYFNNVYTGRPDVVSATTHDELADTDPNLPSNQHGIDAWEKLKLPDPATEAQAVTIGQAVLADFNRAKQPTRVTIAGGWIQDTNEVWHPGWEARVAQAVVLADLDDSRPRLIHETVWDDVAKTLTLTLDAQAETVDALLDQMLTDSRRRDSR